MDVSFRYLNNAQGIILRRDQMKGAVLDKQHRYLYVNGQGVGDIGNDGDQTVIGAAPRFPLV